MAFGQNRLLVMGMMSGTSLDGIDMAIAEFDFADTFSFSLVAWETLPYGEEWMAALRFASHRSDEELQQLDVRYGEFLGHTAKSFIGATGLPVQLIGSHGHTVFHQPEKGITRQIGDGQRIRAITGIPVIYNFRQQDVQLGGQGAPLVPIGDEYLFGEFEACLNLGGFSNISFRDNGRRLACDTGVCNVLLNAISNRLGLAYDDRGALAQSGRIITGILESWNGLPYFSSPPPKSLGREWFEANYMAVVSDMTYREEDLLRTAVEHIADTISAQIRRQPVLCGGKVLITGGGAFNAFLVDNLRAKLSGYMEIVIPDDRIVKFKEALIFAFMAYLNVMNRNNVLSSVTGAKWDHCSGLRAW